MKIINIKIQDLKKYEKNAKKHPEKQIDILAKNIERFGFTTPILIDKNNEIIAGHGRLDALKKLKMETAPCVICEKLNRGGYLMELDPVYVDVIVQRWVDFTGNENIIKNGEEIIWKKSN